MMGVREDILDRLFVTLQTVAPIASFYRSRTGIPDTALPALVLQGGGDDSEEDLDHDRPLTAPHRIIMAPEIYLLVGGAGPGTQPGSVLNTIRVAVLKAVFADTTLAALSLNRTGIAYEGLSTTFESGRTVAGEMALFISIAFILRP